jgi:hypothetical protein
MTRTWVYSRMATDPTLLTYMGTSVVTDPMNTPGDPLDDVTTITPRVYQSTSINATPHLKPFIMYRQTSDVTTFRGDDNDMVRQTGYMIFAHDVPGDYLRIDAMIERLKVLFSNVVDQDEGVIRSSWVETSEDLRDEDMGTITRFARILVIYKV